MATRDWATGRRSTTPASRIPVFASIDEEAAFWDTHSVTEFEDELEDVTGGITFVVRRPDDAIRMLFDEETVSALTERARAEDTDPTILVQQWIRERLRAS
ncbi:MAG TPA: CopG family antitoxin [Thermomicrobiales bacterium]|jgi:hypothetical protein